MAERDAAALRPPTPAAREDHSEVRPVVRRRRGGIDPVKRFEAERLFAAARSER